MPHGAPRIMHSERLTGAHGAQRRVIVMEDLIAQGFRVLHERSFKEKACVVRAADFRSCWTCCTTRTGSKATTAPSCFGCTARKHHGPLSRCSQASSSECELRRSWRTVCRCKPGASYSTVLYCLCGNVDEKLLLTLGCVAASARLGQLISTPISSGT